MSTTTEELISTYHRNGFAIFRKAVDPELVAEAAAHVTWLQAKYPELRPEHLHHPLIRNDAFWVRLVTDQRILDIVSLVLGPDLACFTAHYVCKPPLDGQPVLWHQDAAYWQLDPMTAVSAWLAVDASTTENGCLRMIPGSHRLPVVPAVLRTDTPNMLSSVTVPTVVDEWVERAGIVDVELEPGDISIHHPNILHCSEPNTSPMRRCGLDIGYIPTTTRIMNEGLYLDPILVSGAAVPGVNRYRRYPEYKPDESIAFAGHENWNEKVDRLNREGGFVDDPMRTDTPIAATRTMMARLNEGTVGAAIERSS